MTNRKLSKTLRRLLGVLVCVALVLLTVPAVSLPVSAATSGKTEGGTWRLQGDTLIFSGKGSMAPVLPPRPGTDGDQITVEYVEWWSNVRKNYEENKPWGRNFTKVIIEEGVTNICSRAFAECTKLTSITIPDTVTSIEEQAFFKCRGLTSANIGNSVTTIGSRAFAGCSALATFSLPSSVKSIGGQAFYNCKKLTSIHIPSGVTAIKSETFYGCKALATITLPNSTISIDSGAFDGCTSLTAMHLPKTVKHIGTGIFSSCINLSTLIIEDGNPVYHSSGNCIIHTENTLLVAGCQNSVIPSDESVTAIESCAFYGQENLSSITIPKAVKSIGNSAFSNTGLSSITLSTGITKIGENAFAGCDALTSVVIPNTVKSIASEAFSDCTFLTSITIPDTVTSIGEHAFIGCRDITIRGKFGSYAESYAKKNGFTFVEAKFADYTWVWYVLIAVGGIVLVATGVFVGLLLGKRKKPAIATKTAPVTEPTAVEPTASQK